MSSQIREDFFLFFFNRNISSLKTTSFSLVSMCVAWSGSSSSKEFYYSDFSRELAH